MNDHQKVAEGTVIECGSMGRGFFVTGLKTDRSAALYATQLFMRIASNAFRTEKVSRYTDVNPILS